MLFHQRLAILGTAVLLACLAGRAESTSLFQFPSCVDNCVASSGCESESSKCICKAARVRFLEDVVTCMYYHCKDELRAVDDTFLRPVTAGCDAVRSPIPKDDVRSAEKVADSLLAKLAYTTTVQQTVTKALPVPTAKTPTTAITSTSLTESSSSSSSDGETSTPTEAVVPPTSAIEPPSTLSPTTTQNAPGRVPTDSSPFATFNAASSHNQMGASWLSLPLIIAMVLR